MKTPNYHNALVLGGGCSGMGAARLLRAKGAAVTLIDANHDPERAAAFKALSDEGVRVMPGCTRLPVDDFDIAIVSPGIPADAPWLKTLRKRGIPYKSELELGWCFTGAKTIAITGTLGKSSVATCCHDALQRAGYDAALAGNIGVSVCEQVLRHDPKDWLVLEVSSFQLETVRAFRPDIAVLLNLYPNHLDRHGTLEEYRAAKERLFRRQEGSDVAIIPDTLHPVPAVLASGNARVLHFGCTPDADYTYRDGMICRDWSVYADVSGSWFANPELGVNAAALAAVLDNCRVPARIFEQTLMDFRGLPNRMQRVAECDGVRFVNDSKSTCLAALEGAVRQVNGPVRLIAGGRAKEHDFGAVGRRLAEKTAAVYLFGESAREIYESWSNSIDCFLCNTLREAVSMAGKHAVRGETVLLAPGAASFDQFSSYAERGAEFERLVQETMTAPAKHFTKV